MCIAMTNLARPLQVIQLFGTRCLEEDLPWFVANGLLPPSAGLSVPAAVRTLCQTLGPSAQQLMEAFGIPDHLVAAPIAGDWEAYNAVDNRGELVGPMFT